MTIENDGEIINFFFCKFLMYKKSINFTTHFQSNKKSH